MNRLFALYTFGLQNLIFRRQLRGLLVITLQLTSSQNLDEVWCWAEEKGRKVGFVDLNN